MRHRLFIVSALLVVGIVAGLVFALRYSSLVAESRPAFTLTPDHGDVVYCAPNGIQQRLDIYLPSRSHAGPSPALVYVHGGGFTGGDKAKGNGLIEIPELVGRGYLVAAVNYRLAPTHRFPAPIEDVKCAVRHLRANAATYGLDAERIGIWGGSAGGHLSLLAGLTDAAAGFDRGEYLDQSSRVNAVVDMFGPSDLTAADFSPLQKLLLDRAFGTTSPQDPLLGHASPVSYIGQSAPPILILHGDRDDVVPLSQSTLLFERLRASGASVRMLVVQNGNHNFAPTGGEIRPARDEISRQVADFFDEHLRR